MLKAWIMILLLMQTLAAETLTLSVASNVSYVIEILKAEFLKSHPDTQIRIVLGSSGKLTAQIINGAPYGVFMSADMKYPQRLFEEGLALGKPRMYAQGSLAYLSMKERDFSKGIKLLTDESIHTIALANPKTAPYGKAAIEAIENAGLSRQLKSKFVYAESISQTLSYALTAAEIGIVSKASLYSEKMKRYKEGKHWKEVDINLYEPIRQGMVLLKRSKGSQEYRAFYDFVLSEKGQAILKRCGYII